MSEIPRVVESQEANRLVSMTMMVYSLPRIEKYCQTLVVYPGLGETRPLQEAITEWEMNSSFHEYFLVAGVEWRKEKTSIRPTLENLCRPPFGLDRKANVFCQDHAIHTKDQSEWVVKMIQWLGIQNLAFYASPFHILRAYLTILKAFINLKLCPVPMIPVPVAVSPASVLAEVGTDIWNLVPGEVARIKAYQEKGDVATFQELQEYINGIWQVEPICIDLM